jgi:hypothetical protein
VYVSAPKIAAVVYGVERSQGWRQHRGHHPGVSTVGPPRTPDPYWYEIMLGVGLRVIVWAGVSIGVSSS